jgi:hypothetical protein
MVRFAVLVLLLLAPVGAPRVLAATCYGHDDCRACKNCRYCKHCAKRGGTCGVCKRRHHGASPVERLKVKRPADGTGRG